MDPVEADCCVVGAGFAGLAAAYKLKQAGTETAAEWSGAMEGAIRSGERAADEVLAAG